MSRARPAVPRDPGNPEGGLYVAPFRHAVAHHRAELGERPGACVVEELREGIDGNDVVAKPRSRLAYPPFGIGLELIFDYASLNARQHRVTRRRQARAQKRQGDQDHQTGPLAAAGEQLGHSVKSWILRE